MKPAHNSILQHILFSLRWNKKKNTFVDSSLYLIFHEKTSKEFVWLGFLNIVPYYKRLGSHSPQYHDLKLTWNQVLYWHVFKGHGNLRLWLGPSGPRVLYVLTSLRREWNTMCHRPATWSWSLPGDGLPIACRSQARSFSCRVSPVVTRDLRGLLCEHYCFADGRDGLPCTTVYYMVLKITGKMSQWTQKTNSLN